MAAISKQNWGRIMAKAYLEKDFKDLLQTDPKAAAEKAQKEIPNFPAFDVLYNLAEFDFGQGMDNFQDMRRHHSEELDEIINKKRNRSLTVSELHAKHGPS